MKDNTQKTYLLTSIKSLTFPFGSLNINKRDGSVEMVSLSNISYLDFKKSIVTNFTETVIQNGFVVKIYPNPTMGNPFTLSYQTTNLDLVTLEVLDVSGNSIWNEQYQSQIGYNEIYLQNQKWPSGIYFCRIKIGNSLEIKQLVVKN